MAIWRCLSAIEKYMFRPRRPQNIFKTFLLQVLYTISINRVLMLRSYEHKHLRAEHYMKNVPYWRATITSVWCHSTKYIWSGFVYPCCSSVSRMILKRNGDYSLTNNKLGLDRISLHSCSKKKNSTCLCLTHTRSLLTHVAFLKKKLFSARHRRNWECCL